VNDERELRVGRSGVLGSESSSPELVSCSLVGREAESRETEDALSSSLDFDSPSLCLRSGVEEEADRDASLMVEFELVVRERRFSGKEARGALDSDGRKDAQSRTRIENACSAAQKHGKT